MALLATPLVAPAMPDIAAVYSGQLMSDPVSAAIVSIMGLENDPGAIRFVVKFILLSIPALFIVLGAPFAGWLSDRVGRRRLLIYSLILFGVAGFSGYFVSSLTGLFVGRALLGVSIAGIKTLTVAMVGDYFEGEERARFIGWQGSAMKFGGVVFLLLGGFLADIHWTAPFWGYLLAFVALPGVIFSLYEAAPRVAVQGREAVTPVPLPMLPVAFVLFAAFTASVLFFTTLVQLPFFLKDSFGAAIVRLPLFLGERPGDSPVLAGVATAVANLSGAFIATTFHRFKTRLSYVEIFAFVFLMIGTGYAVLVASGNYDIVLIAMVVAGLGFGLIVPAQSAWIIATVPDHRRGYAIGLVTTAMFLGQFAAPVVTEPFTDPADPGRVFAVASGTLFVLALIYGGRGLLARRGPKNTS